MFDPLSECFSKFVTKNGFKERKFIVMMKNRQLRFTYKSKKCGKKFNTDISEIVEENSNFTHVFRVNVLN